MFCTLLALWNAHLPPYSGAMKCMFFMLSRHVLTWWWIASGATTERKSERNKVRKCIRPCLHGCGVSRSPHPLLSHSSAGQFYTQRLRTDSEGNSFCLRSRKIHDPSHQRTDALGDMPQTPTRSRFVRRFCVPENELDSRETLANQWRFMTKNPPWCILSPWSPIL